SSDAVKRYQTELICPWSGCCGSPVSPVASIVVPPTDPLPEMTTAFTKLSFRGPGGARGGGGPGGGGGGGRGGPGARRRPHVGAGAPRQSRERCRAAIDLEIPDHRVRQPV